MYARIYFFRKGQAMLEFKNVSYVTEDGKEILRNVTLQINDRFVAVTGPNGSGKSTLAKLIAGIVAACVAVGGVAVAIATAKAPAE